MVFKGRACIFSIARHTRETVPLRPLPYFPQVIDSRNFRTTAVLCCTDDLISYNL